MTLREEHRLRVFENGVLKRIFRPKRDKVTGGWRGLHNLCSSPSIITCRIMKPRSTRLAGHIARMRGEEEEEVKKKKKMYRLLVGKP
jgi:hypothetical protein